MFCLCLPRRSAAKTGRYKQLTYYKKGSVAMSNDSGSSPVQGVRWKDRVAIVDVVGDIDLNKSLDFQKSLLEVLEQRPQQIIVNLSEVPYMDSSGVASLVKLLSRTRKSGSQLCLVGLSPRVKSLFEITRLDVVFTIHASEKEAIA